MKWPRLRFSIAGLMGLVLLVGVGLWFQRQARKRQTPTAAEVAAQGRLQMASLQRQLVEFASGYPVPVPAPGPREDLTPDQIRARRLKARQAEVARRRADEDVARADYERERARRLSWW